MPVAPWHEQKAICREILRGNADEAFARYRVSDLDGMVYRRIADEALTRAIARHAPFRHHFKAQIRYPIQWVVMLAVCVAVLAFAGALFLLLGAPPDASGQRPLAPAVGLFAVCATALGWGVSGWVADRSSRAKHTLDIVSKRFSESTFSDAMAHMNKTFAGKVIDSALIAQLATSDDPTDREALQSLRYLLNFFEFISAGVLEGELDARLVAKTLRGNLRFVHDRSAKWIRELQAANPRTLEHLTTLRRHYEEL